MKPLVSVAVVHPPALLHMNPKGFGFCAARYPRNDEFVQLAPARYCVASPALPLAWAVEIRQEDRQR